MHQHFVLIQNNYFLKTHQGLFEFQIHEPVLTPQACDTLEKAGGQGDVLDFVHVAVVFLAVQKALVDADDFLINCIGSKSKGQS